MHLSVTLPVSLSLSIEEGKLLIDISERPVIVSQNPVIPRVPSMKVSTASFWDKPHVQKLLKTKKKEKKLTISKGIEALITNGYFDTFRSTAELSKKLGRQKSVIRSAMVSFRKAGLLQWKMEAGQTFYIAPR